MNYAYRKALSPHDKRCSVENCGGKLMAKGLCTKHYNASYHKRRNRNFYDPSRGHDGIVPVPAKGWGYLPYWEVPF